MSSPMHNRDYYDEFSHRYEAERGRGYHALIDDLVDDRRIVPRIEVVDQLGALVTDEPAVLELRMMLHRSQR